MKNMKKMIVLVTAIGVLGATGVGFAAAMETPAEITASLTGRTVVELQQERASGKTYGTLAKEAGKLEEFKEQMLLQRKAVLDERVKAGIMTEAQADEAYEAIKNNQAVCDATGSSALGKAYGLGQGNGMGKGQGAMRGAGMQNGRGMRFGVGLNR